MLLARSSLLLSLPPPLPPPLSLSLSSYLLSFYMKKSRVVKEAPEMTAMMMILMVSGSPSRAYRSPCTKTQTHPPIPARRGEVVNQYYRLVAVYFSSTIRRERRREEGWECGGGRKKKKREKRAMRRVETGRHGTPAITIVATIILIWIMTNLSHYLHKEAGLKTTQSLTWIMLEAVCDSNLAHWLQMNTDFHTVHEWQALW